MRGETFHPIVFGQYSYLWENGHRLQPQGERPLHVPPCHFSMNDKGHDQGEGDKVPVGEVVLGLSVVGVLVGRLQVHEVEDVEGDCDEENFHYGIVGGDVGEEEVHVASAENYKVNFLGLCTDTVAFFVSVDFVDDDYE